MENETENNYLSKFYKRSLSMEQIAKSVRAVTPTEISPKSKQKKTYLTINKNERVLIWIFIQIVLYNIDRSLRLIIPY